MSATHILLPQQLYLNVIERKYKRQILMPDPIILDPGSIMELVNLRDILLTRLGLELLQRLKLLLVGSRPPFSEL